jgi:hypothetical protein
MHEPAKRRLDPGRCQSGRAVERQFRFDVSERGLDAAHLLGGQLRQEEVRKTAAASQQLRFVYSALDERGWEPALKLSRQLHADRFFQVANQIGKRPEAGAVDGTRT